MNVILIDGTKVEVDEKIVKKYRIDERVKTPFSHLKISRSTTDEINLEEGDFCERSEWDM